MTKLDKFVLFNRGGISYISDSNNKSLNLFNDQQYFLKHFKSLFFSNFVTKLLGSTGFGKQNCQKQLFTLQVA